MSTFLIVWSGILTKGKLFGTGMSPDVRVLPLGSSDPIMDRPYHVHTSSTVTFRKVQL